LEGNKLTELAATIGNLRSLRFLGVEGNRLSELPSTIGSLTNLEELDASGNALQDAEKQRVRAALPNLQFVQL
jgi:Leucine-rich repeat (LRR) protein